MGFFEDNGLLYFKKYNISLDLLLKGDTTSPYQIRFDNAEQEENKKEMDSEPVQAFNSEKKSIGHYVFGKNQKFIG